MIEIINNLDTGFVMAVILFLVFFSMGLLAALADMFVTTKEKKEYKRFLENHHTPIGRVTDYWVGSYRYQPKNYKKGG